MIDPKIFDSLLEPTFVINAEKKITYINETASLIIDVSVRKASRSQPLFSEVLQFADPISALDSLPTLTEPSPYQEVHFKTAAGKTGRVQLTVQPLSADQYLIYFRDVTLEETLQRKYRAELEKKESVIADLEIARNKLEDYSKNLEKMVAERTAQLSTLNQQLNALLDSLGQGFFIFGPDGVCFPISSKACLSTIERNPEGLTIEQALNLDENSGTSFRKWMKTLFMEMLPFEDLAPLGPQSFEHSQGRKIQLQYYPLRNADQVMEGVVVVSTDITELVASQEEAEREKKHAQSILQLVSNKRQVLGFLREAEGLIINLNRDLAKPEIDFETTFRGLHTLKGGAASFGLNALAESVHHAEDLLSLWNKKKRDTTRTELTAEVEKFPHLIEQFLDQNKALLGQKHGSVEILKEVSVSDLKRHFNALPEGLPQKQQFFQEFLLEPAKDLFSHFNDQIRMVANNEGKIMQPLLINDPEFRLWPDPYESLFANFIHAFRNSVDHGIENPVDRETLGKPSAGRIGIDLSLQGDRFKIEIWDDGQGVDPDAVRRKLIKNGKTAEAAKPDHEVIQHIFDSAFSTRDTVTETSGRGVGMDAILAAAVQLGGRAWVTSERGQGARTHIEVPWNTTESKISIPKAS